MVGTVEEKGLEETLAPPSPPPLLPNPFCYRLVQSYAAGTSPTMPQHIRDLNVYPARKFKFNKDNRRTDNRENDQKMPDMCILQDYELTRFISY